MGGLVGANDGGTVTESFWDIQTSGQTASDGGTSKTTAELVFSRLVSSSGCAKRAGH